MADKSYCAPHQQVTFKTRSSRPEATLHLYQAITTARWAHLGTQAGGHASDVAAIAVSLRPLRACLGVYAASHRLLFTAQARAYRLADSLVADAVPCSNLG